MTATAPKIKAFLATIKETVLDNEDVSLEDSFLSLLRLELVQRGVIVPDTDQDKLVLALQTNAGKALLEENSVPKMPKPLLAGAAVLTGRVCEKVVALLRSSTVKKSILSAEAIRATLDRCQQVEDSRIAVLLRIVTQIQQEEDPPGSDTGIGVMALQRLFYVAEGNYCRAASFQPDAPPMWKKVWDMISERRQLQPDVVAEISEIHWEAVTALGHLCRIAATKGNAKRATELALRWSESLLRNINADSPPNDEHLQECMEAFISPYRRITPTPAVDASKEAIRILHDTTLLERSQLADQDAFIYLLVDLKAYLGQEESLIVKQAQDNLKLAQNRAQEGSKSKTTKPLADFVQKSRKEHLVSTLDDESVDKAAVALRDAIYQVMEDSVSKVRKAEGDTLMLQYLTRQQERAQVVAIQSKNVQGWLLLAEFIRPVVAFWKSGVDGSDDSESLWTVKLNETSSTAIRVHEAVVCIVPTIEWMVCGAQDGTRVFDAPHMALCRDIAAALQERARGIEENVVSAGVVSSKTKDLSAVRLECALASLESFVALDTEIGSPSTQHLLRRITEVAVGRSDTVESYPVFAGELGFSFIEFVLAWSGLHRSPWPFCTQPEARALVAKAMACLDRAEKEWGRSSSSLERALLCLAEADAETISFAGCLSAKAREGYDKVIESASSIPSREVAGLLVSRSDTGRARLVMNSHDSTGEEKDKASAEELAKRTLDQLQSMEESDLSSELYMWRASGSLKACVQQQIAMARQLVADALIQSGKASIALQFLVAAVKDAPQDAAAAFALGAFMLRMMFFGESERSPESEKAAQVQLLKAAKLDSTSASPFALLGFWFEYKGDDKRAVGCYSKALLLDPAHPVAGRGVLRKAPPDTIDSVLDKALSSSSPQIGWAWRAMASKKALAEGKDDLAVVSLVKALRCRDIERPEAESLSVFHASPLAPKLPGKHEISHVHAELAACYRRLGRYTASIRSYYAAIEDMEGDVSNSVLCACAQVELELGLLDEAVDKFSLALRDKSMGSVAAYGQGVALLALAQRDIQDGKVGCALERVQTAIAACQKLDNGAFGCTQKLLGDLHTFGASFPPGAFGSEDAYEDQVKFIASGEEAYRKAEKAIVSPTEDESKSLRSGLLTDLGANLLLQAQLLAINGDERANEVFERSAAEFRRALEISSLFAPAWCGLGCSVAKSDPLLSQHAFCRALELDNFMTDAYANLSFLYTTHGNFGPSASLSDALTQVADTPMMWINRALILEREGKAQQASDAYAAALQVVKEPAATIGLAMTSRQTSERTGESLGLATEYLGRVGSSDVPARVVQGLLTIEDGTLSTPDRGVPAIQKGKQRVSEALDRLNAEQADGLNVASVRASVEAVEADKKTDVQDGTLTQEWSLSRQILLEPHRGDLWVEYTKELALAGTIDSAAVAANKATTLLDQQWSRSKASHVNAETLADALAMKYWLEQSANESPAGAPHDKGLQRSLLMFPSNVLGRHALQQSLEAATIS